MSSRISELNKTPIQDGPGNVYWVDAKIIVELKLKEVKYRESPKGNCKGWRSFK